MHFLCFPIFVDIFANIFDKMFYGPSPIPIFSTLDCSVN